ncbi:serine protease [Okeania sp. SIO2B3]|uniref:S1 family peptidase n=1 Tax=Okeania sp. SIO2B3 TaxID=2607784 RepID=UPI0013BEBEA6|nr:trypsin-like peptidase domain-containing protein [Okeania sp. SIO2B3]NET43296.1 trypsin-like serine protease [Okeania sp. SIO2B3]
MKSLPRILGLAFLALILTLTLANCSLSSQQIYSRLKPSIVKLSYRNQPGHGTGFFVPGEKGVCTVLTAAHVVEKEGERLLQTNQDGKFWPVAEVEIFPSDIDLALVTFRPEGGKCNYPALKIGNSESLKTGSSIYISGFPKRGGRSVYQSVSGEISGSGKLGEGYEVSYDALTVGGMSGSPVVDEKGEVVAVHGRSDFEVVESFSSLQGSLSESQRQTFEQAVERVETGLQLTFSWGIPIHFFQEYQQEKDRKRAIALGREREKVKLQGELEKKQQKLEEAERRVRELRQEVEQGEEKLKVEQEELVQNQNPIFPSLGDRLLCRRPRKLWWQQNREQNRVQNQEWFKKFKAWATRPLPSEVEDLPFEERFLVVNYFLFRMAVYFVFWVFYWIFLVVGWILLGLMGLTLLIGCVCLGIGVYRLCLWVYNDGGLREWLKKRLEELKTRWKKLRNNPWEELRNNWSEFWFYWFIVIFFTIYFPVMGIITYRNVCWIQ